MNSKEQILNMVKEGNISIEEALQLLNALEPKETISIKKPSNRRMIRIDVDSEEGKVKVNIPLSLIKVGMDISEKLNIDGKKIDLHGIDLDDIIAHIDEETAGEILSVDTEKGEKVRIFVE